MKIWPKVSTSRQRARGRIEPAISIFCPHNTLCPRREGRGMRTVRPPTRPSMTGTEPTSTRHGRAPASAAGFCLAVPKRL